MSIFLFFPSFSTSHWRIFPDWNRRLDRQKDLFIAYLAKGIYNQELSRFNEIEQWAWFRTAQIHPWRLYQRWRAICLRFAFQRFSFRQGHKKDQRDFRWTSYKNQRTNSKTWPLARQTINTSSCQQSYPADFIRISASKLRWTKYQSIYKSDLRARLQPISCCRWVNTKTIR